MYVTVNKPKRMSSHFKWYPGSEEVVVPWNARYAFPSQANKAVKITPRIPPKNGGTFLPGNVIRLEFPAQGYVNPANTTMSFDVTLGGFGTANDEIVRFQNNIQSIFQRVRLLYGSTPLEDIINYNVIVRGLTEWTSTSQNGTMDQSSISEGIGGYITQTTNPVTFATVTGVSPTSGTLALPVNGNVRQNYIQGSDQTSATGMFPKGSGKVPASSAAAAQTLTGSAVQVTRRYQVQFALGLFTQGKLIPTKFMASQLAIELTLATEAQCMFSQLVQGGTAGAGSSPTYGVTNVNLIPEILEFDSSYGKSLVMALKIRRNVPQGFARGWRSHQVLLMAHVRLLDRWRIQCQLANSGTLTVRQGYIHSPTPCPRRLSA